MFARVEGIALRVTTASPTLLIERLLCRIMTSKTQRLQIGWTPKCRIT